MNWEEAFDFTNWREHPTRKKYMVFFFADVAQGDYFEELLKEKKIWFERHHDEEDEQRPVWFAVERGDMNVVKQLNHLTLGKFRNKFIPTAGLRWMVFIFSGIVIALMIVGMMKGNQ